MHTINHVRKFHEAFGHPVADRPTAQDAAIRALRVNLIAEELGELCVALGVELSMNCDGVNEAIVVVRPGLDSMVDLVATADALGDLDYVVQGANLVFGLPAEEVLVEIQRSNMSKLGADGEPIRREDGKILKGPNYSPPDLVRVLKDWTHRL